MTAHPWARHYQESWLERAGDPELPDWLRVASLAYGRHRANGHAMFQVGQLSLILSRVDEQTGVVLRMDRRNVFRAIQVAVSHKWLASGSTARCLIVPAHAVTGGLGDALEACPQHTKRHHSAMTFPTKRHRSAMTTGVTQ